MIDLQVTVPLAVCIEEVSLLTPIWVTIISSLLSGLISVIISSCFYTCFYRRYENRKRKFDTLRRLLGNRFAITEGQESNAESSREEFFAALNGAVVVFHDSAPVLDALNDYHESKSPDSRLRLFKAMCKNLKVRYEFNDSFFDTPFTPGPKVQRQ